MTIRALTDTTYLTKAPTGLSVVRKNNDLTIKWKIADKNYGDGQQLQWRVNTGSLKGFTTGSWSKWQSVSITKTTTAKTVSLTLSNYYPTVKNNPLNGVQFRVRGKRSSFTVSEKVKNGKKTVTVSVTKYPSWSDWSLKSVSLETPNRPTATAELSDSYDNVSTFSWNTVTSNADWKFYRDVQYQTCLILNSSKTGSQYDKNFGSTVTGAAASGSVTKTEDATQLAQGSYRRWYRFRSRGSKEASEWRYVSHLYATPYRAVINEAKATANGAGGYDVYVNWTATADNQHEIDSTFVQYTIDTPASGLVCPPGATWTDASTTKDTKDTDAVSFAIDNTAGIDECVWVRVNTQHDRNVTYGEPYKVASGYLADPTGVSVTNINNTTHRATINATNNSSVPGSFMAVIYRPENHPNKSVVVGVIPNGSSTVTVQCPNWDDEGAVGFGVYAAAGGYTNRSGAYGIYQIDSQMRSQNTVWKGGTVPVAPSNVSVTPTEQAGVIQVAWDWTWTDADVAELSWSTDPLAWESTTEPTSYEITSTNSGKWYISGLETGETWYVSVRLIMTNGDVRTLGPWSEPVSIDLSSAPSIPVMVLSDSIIAPDGSVTAYWAYSTTDGTAQAYAEITTAVINADGIWYGEYALTTDNTVVAGKDYFSESGGIYTLETPGGTENPESLGWYEVVPNIIAHTESAQHITIYADDPKINWTAGNTYNLCVRVVSASGRQSNGWSDPVGVTVATPLTATISATSLVSESIVDTSDMTRTINSLKAMPLTATITGAGTGGTTTLVIERAETYHMDRPDETHFNGYEGETIAIMSQVGESQITVALDNLIGRLDDGAPYRLIATVQDKLGQSATTSMDFEVHWTHQALVPSATAAFDSTDRIMKITPVAPVGADPTDVADIYRLSVDRPQLVVKDAQFGTVYVDPYPAIGELGGHRVVLRTANGDYITASEQPAWVDLRSGDNDVFFSDTTIIDFDGNTLECQYNTGIANSFEKDFKETAYLGGAIQGDWNPIVRRTGSVSATIVMPYEPDTMRKLRQLASYTGICHVRTTDGSSYAADVQVGDDVSYDTAGKLLKATLSITRVDPEGYDGMSLTDWEEGTS